MPYLLLKFVDNSRVAEHHQHQRKQVDDQKYRGDHHRFGGVAAVGAPRDTRVIDDVRADPTDADQKSRNDDPSGHHRDVARTLLEDELHRQRLLLASGEVYLRTTDHGPHVKVMVRDRDRIRLGLGLRLGLRLRHIHYSGLWSASQWSLVLE